MQEANPALPIKTILAIGAHHDDNELIAGTIAKHKQAGHRVISVVITDGVYINGKISKEHIKIREQESQDAAEVLGIECEFLRSPEGCVENQTNRSLALMKVIRKYSPQIVITHPPEDYHMDHIIANKCTIEAIHMSWNSCIEPQLSTCKMPKLYYCEPWFIPFQPDEYIDISDQIDLKLQALECHKSQHNTGGRIQEDMVEMARHASRTRGIEASVQYAEAFRLHPTMGSVRLSNTLG